MSFKEYSLKFVKIFKYASFLVSNSRDEMSRFLTGVSEDMEEECRSAMLHDNIYLGRLMVHPQKVEDSHWRKRGRESKKTRPSYQVGSSTGRSSFGVQDRSKFKKGHQHSSNPTSSRNTNTKEGKSCLKRGNDRNAQRDRNLCGKCGHLHGGECLVGTNACYGFGKSGNIIRDLHVKNQAKEDTQPLSNPIVVAEPRKMNKFYALKGTEEQKKSADVVTGNLLVFSLPVYALLDSGSTLSFVTPLVSIKFDLLPKILHEPFLVSTLIGDIIRHKRVYRDCTITILDIFIHADLIELTMLYFYIILGIDWLRKCYCKTPKMT